MDMRQGVKEGDAACTHLPSPRCHKRVGARKGLWIPAAARMADGFFKANNEDEDGLCSTKMAYVHFREGDFNNLKIPEFWRSASFSLVSDRRVSVSAQLWGGVNPPALRVVCRLEYCQPTLPDASLWLRPPRAQTRTSRRRYTRPAAGWLRPSEMMARYRPRASAKRLRWKRGSPR